LFADTVSYAYASIGAAKNYFQIKKIFNTKNCCY